MGGKEAGEEILFGALECAACGARYPILAGVAILVDDVRDYLLGHVKGISALVADTEIPAEYRRDFVEAKREIRAEHIEEDLEAQRVVSLYLLTHYFNADASAPAAAWWKPTQGEASPLIDELVRKHWDHGPLAQVAEWLGAEADAERAKVVELGCGVGGLSARIRPERYLGVDSSFASIALARRLALGAPYRAKIRIPEDLLGGGAAREIALPPPPARAGARDFVVGDFEHPPVAFGEWDASVALNTIDMLENPERLPEMQKALVRAGGRVVQSCPYIWHENVSRRLRARLGKEPIRDSARAVEWLYAQHGLEVRARRDHIPWLFFKHARQLEIYSVHAFIAVRP